jgi:hypothetical protein
MALWLTSGRTGALKRVEPTQPLARWPVPELGMGPCPLTTYSYDVQTVLGNPALYDGCQSLTCNPKVNHSSHPRANSL